MSGFGRFLSLLAVVAAAIWFAHSPASAQSSSRIIETVGNSGTQRVASALATNPTSGGNFSLAQAATPEKRIALVIGNSNYEAAKALPNPTNDAKAVSALFNQAGFEVVMAFDLDKETLRQVVAEFTEKVKEKGPNTVALVYYAGHGLQVDGDNYLVPVDAKFEKQEDVAEQGVRLADVTATLATAQSKALIFILDACRNNPFSSLNDVAGKGLAIVDAPAGSIIAYSTAPGTEAFDGQGTYSPYAAALMRTIKTPNLPIEQVFKKVRVLVDDTTNSKQMPWESSSLTTDFVFFTNASLDTAATPVVPKVEVAQLRTRSVEQAYEVVVAEDSVEYYEEFVRIYPTHPLCDFIRSKLSRRLQMVAWHNATKQNNAAAYSFFLAKHGNSDLGKFAKKLHDQPKIVVTPKIGINIGNIGNGGIKSAPVIPFQKSGNGGGFGNGNGGLGIKTGPVINNGGINAGGQGGLGIKTGSIIPSGGTNGAAGNTGIAGGIKPGSVINNPNTGSANTGINGGIRPGSVIPTTGNGQNGNVIKTAPAGNVITTPNTGNTGINGGKVIPQVATRPVINNPQVINNGQINTNARVLNNPQINNNARVLNNPQVINRAQINTANVQRLNIQTAPRITVQQTSTPRISSAATQFRAGSFAGSGGGGRRR